MLSEEADIILEKLVKELSMKMFAENNVENRLEYSGTELDSKRYELILQ